MLAIGNYWNDYLMKSTFTKRFAKTETIILHPNFNNGKMTQDRVLLSVCIVVAYLFCFNLDKEINGEQAGISFFMFISYVNFLQNLFESLSMKKRNISLTNH